jgi:multidrug efflux pump subunit AcrA (membrane-fusion protein)
VSHNQSVCTRVVQLCVCCQVDANEQLLAGRLNRTALTLLSSRDPLTPAAPLSPQQRQQQRQQQQRDKHNRNSSSGSDGSHSEQQCTDTAPASEEDPWMLSASTNSGTTIAAAAAAAAQHAARTAARSPPRMTASASARALAASTTKATRAVAVADEQQQQQQQQHTHRARSDTQKRPASAPHRRVKLPGGVSPPPALSRVASHQTVGAAVVSSGSATAAADQLNEYIAEMERLTCDAKAALSALRCEGGGGGGSAAVTLQRYWRYTVILFLLILYLHSVLIEVKYC